MNIKVNKSKNLKEKVKSSQLGFGQVFTDHMFKIKYHSDKGWYNAEIIPYGDISLSPAATVFHYGQETFEGLKAYKSKSGQIRLFRPRENFKRLNKSNQRLCMPTVNIDDMMKALKQLIKLEESWIPTEEGTSLYIRPFVIATNPYLGVKASDIYELYIILSPVGSYYKTGLTPTKILVEENFVRAVKGGTGTAKAGGNYAASLQSIKNAQDKGCNQVLFLDAIERRYVEEIGTSNAFFKIDEVVYTPPLTGTILPGITRASVIELLKSKKIEVVEKRLTIEEIYQASLSGSLKEIFATGTAAVISPIGELIWNDKSIVANDRLIGPISQLIYEQITDIQVGNIDDPFNWIEIIE